MIESFLNTSYINLDKLRLSSIYFFSGIYKISLILVSAVFITILFSLYKCIRRKFPVKVNCWFCNSYTSVPYEFSNCWDCPSCKQYNGFAKDGGYNKVIKEQFSSKLNEGIFNLLKPSLSRAKSKNDFQSNGFCKLCNINQQLKIQQLALFVPLNENKYFEEIEEFREKLEKAYKLCSKCEKTLQQTLEKQEYNLLQNRLNDHQENISSTKSEVFALFNANKILPVVATKAVVFSGLRWMSLIIAGVLLLALFFKFETENNIANLTLPDIIILGSWQPYLKILTSFFLSICKFGRELSFLGFFSSFMVLSNGLTKTNQVNLIVWGLLHILQWSNLTGFQVFMAVVSVFFNVQMVKSKRIYFKKKALPKKYTFQPEKRMFPEVFELHKDQLISKTNKLVFAQNNITESKQTVTDNNDTKISEQSKTNIKKTSPIDEKKKKKKKENEVEIPTNELLIKAEPSTSSASTSLSSSIFNKSFLKTLNVDKNEEGNVPLNEVYSNLNDLHLGGNQKKSKPSNFLFVNHNFSEKKNTSSIIKPAKFIKNVSNSWTGTESNESLSRSSTPSSGYSSQKAEKIDPLNRFEFTKSISPISINPFSRPNLNCFEYWDGNNPYYNNINCFSPGFMPFQHFPGPLGNTAIYTCSRPPNFLFPYSWQGFSPQKFSPTSPRLSDTSDCENLFQNASKSFESNKKWFKLKTISYWFSICLNLITLICLVYFISSGIISVDWNLPKLNFFV